MYLYHSRLRFAMWWPAVRRDKLYNWQASGRWRFVFRGGFQQGRLGHGVYCTTALQALSQGLSYRRGGGVSNDALDTDRGAGGD